MESNINTELTSSEISRGLQRISPHQDEMIDFVSAKMSLLEIRNKLDEEIPQWTYHLDTVFGVALFTLSVQTYDKYLGFIPCLVGITIIILTQLVYPNKVNTKTFSLIRNGKYPLKNLLNKEIDKLYFHSIPKMLGESRVYLIGWASWFAGFLYSYIKFLNQF